MEKLRIASAKPGARWQARVTGRHSLEGRDAERVCDGAQPRAWLGPFSLLVGHGRHWAHRLPSEV